VSTIFIVVGATVAAKDKGQRIARLDLDGDGGISLVLLGVERIFEEVWICFLWF